MEVKILFVNSTFYEAYKFYKHFKLKKDNKMKSLYVDSKHCKINIGANI